jgi:hypothetical protein
MMTQLILSAVIAMSAAKPGLAELERKGWTCVKVTLIADDGSAKVSWSCKKPPAKKSK